VTFKNKRLGDFDAVVLAAARIGILKTKPINRRRLHKWSAPVVGIFMHDKRVDVHMQKLQRAGELAYYVADGKLKVIFPNTDEWKTLQGMRAIRDAIKRHRGLTP
jgi:hypothetical protein